MRDIGSCLNFGLFLIFAFYGMNVASLQLSVNGYTNPCPGLQPFGPIGNGENIRNVSRHY